MEDETPIVTTKNVRRYCGLISTPQLLTAFASDGVVDSPRHDVRPPFTVGRHSNSGLFIGEQQISRLHFVITEDSPGLFEIEDKSTNGTFLNGKRLWKKSRLQHNDLIRLGNVLVVFQTGRRAILDAVETTFTEFSGPFYRGRLIRELKEAARGDRDILLSGPSGSGKELAAKILSEILSDDPSHPMPIVAHNAARFSSEADATTALFGVAAGTFTGVESRPGLIESARNRLLFLDEIHNLPERVQRSLLRVIEDRQLTRIGSATSTKTTARFVFGSNAPAPTFGLAPDLLARLRIVQVLPLSERIADIPAIFNHVLENAFARHGKDVREVKPLLTGEHYEMLCLDKFTNDNVRGIVDLIDRLVTRIAEGADTEWAVESVFSERFGFDDSFRKALQFLKTQTPFPSAKPESPNTRRTNRLSPTPTSRPTTICPKQNES
jgi:sigma54-dependent transcription regulator